MRCGVSSFLLRGQNDIPRIPKRSPRRTSRLCAGRAIGPPDVREAGPQERAARLVDVAPGVGAVAHGREPVANAPGACVLLLISISKPQRSLFRWPHSPSRKTGRTQTRSGMTGWIGLDCRSDSARGWKFCILAEGARGTAVSLHQCDIAGPDRGPAPSMDGRKDCLSR